MMKHMMKYRQILRALAWALALALLVGCATLPALAKPEAETEEDLYMTWTRFSSTGMVNGHDPETDTTYRYSTVTMMSPRIRFLPGAYYQYANTVEAENGRALKVLAPGFGSDFILLDDGTLMATNEGKKFLNALASYKRGFAEYRIVSDALSGSLDEDFYEAVKNTRGATGEKHSLFSLRDETYYTILGFDSDGWFGVPVGFIFEMDDGLYFASALSLEEDCYDENGDLLPKSKVDLLLYPLDEEMTDAAYGQIKNILFSIPSYTYENGSTLLGNMAMGGTSSQSAIYSTVVVMGILLPAAPITLGLCLPRSRRLGYKRRWYLLAALGGAWLVLGMGILITMAVLL